MKIAVDGYELNSSFTGIGRFLLNLLTSLSQIDKENSYTLFLKEKYDLPENSSNIRTIVLKSEKSHTRWQNSDLRKALNRGDFDLFFSPNHSLPLFYKGLSLMTIPDVSWKGVPGDFSFKERTVRDLKTRLSIKKSPLIFTISGFSKKEIIKYYNVSSEKIVPVHLGIENKFRRSTNKDIAKFREKYKLGSSHLIGFLGSMFERRHINELISAYNELKREIDVKLILAGENHYKNGPSGLNDPEIIYLQRLPEEEMNNFYSSLDLFVYLSEYEGFGFPPLEALSCGTPPLLLNSSSLSEVYKNTAFFVEDTSPSELNKKIKDILDNGEEQAGKFLENFKSEKEYFSWERTAGEFLKHFNSFKKVEK